jgi:hypothetical protein
LSPPDEFYKIIDDFVGDILITFPEYVGIVGKWWNKSSDDNKQKETLFVFRHCMKVFPERFFDILYKNVEIFSDESDTNTEFLPAIVFKQLWNTDISDTTRDTIWKYLQLILFSVIGSVHSSSELGDTAKLFEAINEDELKAKLQETLENMQKLFSSKSNESEPSSGEPSSGDSDKQSDEGINMDKMPNAEDIHAHIQSMMGGKLGKLAMELAEETAKDLNLDMEDATTASDVFQNMFKNPGKMMGMVKNIGSKIDEKIKSGEIKESELMEEGMELLNKMKDMPGMGDMQKMFAQMGIPGLGKGAKMNMGAMESQLNKNMKNAQMKERMKAKVEAKAKADLFAKAAEQTQQQKPTISDEELLKIFSTGEKVDRTPRGAKPPPAKKGKGKK